MSGERLSLDTTERHLDPLTKAYLHFAHDTPTPEQFATLLAELEDKKLTFETRFLMGVVKLDAAIADDSYDHSVRPTLLHESMSHFAKMHRQPAEIFLPNQLTDLYKASVYYSYWEQYAKFINNAPSDIEDQRATYLALITAGQKTLKPYANRMPPRTNEVIRANQAGAQFEIGIQLLNARFNLKHKEVLQYMWPSLPRQDEPRGSFTRVRTVGMWRCRVQDF